MVPLFLSFVVGFLCSLALSTQLLRPWNPAFGMKYSRNQVFVMFKDWAPPSRLRSWIKRDIMSRRSNTHFESCKSIVAARSGDNGNNENDWFDGSAAVMQLVMPHCVRSLFYNGAAYDFRMQRVVRACLLMPCSSIGGVGDAVLQNWCDGFEGELQIAEEVRKAHADEVRKAGSNNKNINDSDNVALFCGAGGEVVVLSAFVYAYMFAPEVSSLLIRLPPSAACPMA